MWQIKASLDHRRPLLCRKWKEKTFKKLLNCCDPFQSFDSLRDGGPGCQGRTLKIGRKHSPLLASCDSFSANVVDCSRQNALSSVHINISRLRSVKSWSIAKVLLSADMLLAYSYARCPYCRLLKRFGCQKGNTVWNATAKVITHDFNHKSYRW